MGIKRLKFHMFPWAFHHLSCLHIQTSEPPPPKTIKLIKSDGLVKIYDRPINVSELMTEFPKHMVCKSDAFYIGQKVPALSENEQLQLGQNYFMLPKSFFQSVVSFFTLASFTSATATAKGDSRNAFLKKAGSCQPLDIQKTPSGSLKIRVSDEFISQLMVQGRIKDEDREDEKSKVCTSAELKKDYTQLVGSRRLQWKPKLETIKENEKKKRRFYSFGLKRRKSKSQSKSKSKSISNPKSKSKSQTKTNSKSKSKTNQQIIIRSTDEQKIKPPLKSRKIKFRSKKSSL